MADTMLAGRLHVRAGRLRMERVPIPSPGEGQVLVRVAAAGVCLSDVHLVQGSLKPAQLEGDVVTLGHETAGTVAATGPRTGRWSVGDRVVLQGGEAGPGGTVLTRGVDYDGGWSEYTLASAGTLVPLPDTLPFEQACFIPDAVSTPWAAITETAAVRAAESAGVWGVGGLGAHAVQLLRLVGAMPVIAFDPLPAARERAVDLGADLALDPADPKVPDAVREATDGHGLDAAFDFAGAAPVREQAAPLLARNTVLRRGGRLVLVGLTDQPLTVPDGTLFSFAGQSLLGHYGSGPGHVAELIRLVRGGRLDLSRSVSAVLPLADAPEALRRLDAKTGHPIRIVLRP